MKENMLPRGNYKKMGQVGPFFGGGWVHFASAVTFNMLIGYIRVGEVIVNAIKIGRCKIKQNIINSDCFVKPYEGFYPFV